MNKNRKMRIVLSLITILIIILLSGCFDNNPDAPHEGIITYSTTTSISGDDGITHFTYNLVITNENKSKYTIESVNPVLSQKLRTRLIDDETLKIVDKSIESMESIEVGDVLSFSTEKLSKNEIEQLFEEIREYDIVFEKTMKVK